MKALPIGSVLLSFNAVWLKYIQGYFGLAYMRVLALAGSQSDPLPNYVTHLHALWLDALLTCIVSLVLTICVFRRGDQYTWLTKVSVAVVSVGATLYCLVPD
jgi:hypothetical protein